MELEDGVFLTTVRQGVQELDFDPLISSGMQLSMQVSIEVKGQSSGARHLMF